MNPCLQCKENFFNKFCIYCDNAIQYFLNETIRYILKKDYRIEFVCYIFLEKDLEIFKHIPDQHKSWGLCEYVITRDPSLFEYVPDEFVKKGRFMRYDDYIHSLNCVIL